MNMPIEQLFNYGVAGVMLVFFMYKEISFNKKIMRAIENNTLALNNFSKLPRNATKHPPKE